MRAMALNRLSSRKVDTLKDPGIHADGGGLYLNVTKSGSKSWLFIYRFRGKRREKGLGSLAAVGLGAARDRAAELRTLIAANKDPMDHRDIPEDNPSFGECATALIAELEPGWKNDKHKWQWRHTLETYAAALWNRPVAAITTTDIVDVIRPMWAGKRETAMRLRGRIEKVLDAAKVKGHRTGDNPARWRGHIELVMPKKKRGEAGVRHHPAMPYAMVPDFVPGLRTRLGMGARALEFLIHTAARTNEVLKAEWREIDMDTKLWTVPGHRMKMGVEHIVPLAEPALAILRAMAMFGTKPEAPVFPGTKGAPLSGMSMEMTLRRMECDEFTVHGFRSAFRDWAGEETDFPRDVIEMALAHQVGSEVERAYRRGTALAKRRELMEAWSAFVVGA